MICSDQALVPSPSPTVTAALRPRWIASVLLALLLFGMPFGAAADGVDPAGVEPPRRQRDEPARTRAPGLSFEFAKENWDHPSVIAGTTDHGWIRSRIDDYEEIKISVVRPFHRVLRAEFAWRGAQRSRVSRSFDYRRQVFGLYVRIVAD